MEEDLFDREASNPNDFIQANQSFYKTLREIKKDTEKNLFYRLKSIKEDSKFVSEVSR
jgi:hypothetical protein